MGAGSSTSSSTFAGTATAVIVPPRLKKLDHHAPPFYPAAPEEGELDKISVVIPKKLFLSNWRAAENKEACRELGITHVAAVGTEFLEDEEGGICYWKCDVPDDDTDEAREAMASALKAAGAFINKCIQGGGRCLVHCAAGISRSATCVLAYLLLHRKMTLHDALGLVLRARRPVWPNDSFMKALIALEMESHKPAPPTITLALYAKWGDYEPPADAVERELEIAGRPETPKAPPRPKFMKMSTFVSRSARKMVAPIMPAASPDPVPSPARSPSAASRRRRARASISRPQREHLEAEAEKAFESERQSRDGRDSSKPDRSNCPSPAVA